LTIGLQVAFDQSIYIVDNMLERSDVFVLEFKGCVMLRMSVRMLGFGVVLKEWI